MTNEWHRITDDARAADLPTCEVLYVTESGHKGVGVLCKAEFLKGRTCTAVNDHGRYDVGVTWWHALPALPGEKEVD